VDPDVLLDYHNNSSRACHLDDSRSVLTDEREDEDGRLILPKDLEKSNSVDWDDSFVRGFLSGSKSSGFTAVRARPGRLSALSGSNRKSVLYGAFVFAQGA
jgi:hypothetical protein